MTVATNLSPASTPIPITVLTGFLGSGKTTLLLSLLPQLPAGYKLCLLKNEFGDVEVDARLAEQGAISGTRELLNGCICCNLVGQLGDALLSLRDDYRPSRIVVETSGSAFPATLAMEVNRLARENPNSFILDGVIQVIDVENWKGYADTSYTAKLQANYTDLIILNKHELAGPQLEETVFDRIHDLGSETPIVRSDNGWVSKDVVFGVDSALAKLLPDAVHTHAHDDTHSSEVEVLSVTLPAPGYVDCAKLKEFLEKASGDEVYRIKGIVRCRGPPPQHKDANVEVGMTPPASGRWILNWAFGRWTFTPLRVSSVRTTIEAPEGRNSPVELDDTWDANTADEDEEESEDEKATREEIDTHVEAANGVNSIPSLSLDGELSPPPSAFARKGSIEVLVKTSIQTEVEELHGRGEEDVVRLSVVCARGEGERWRRRIGEEGWIVGDVLRTMAVVARVA